MNHRLRQLGVGLVAVLALSLAITSSAVAAQFTTTSYPTTSKQTGSSAYGHATTEAGNVECSSASASATLSEASSTLTIVEGTSSGCKAFGGLSATISSNGCSSLVHVKEETAADTYKAAVDLLCPAGKTITTVTSTCETQVAPQNGNATVKLTNDTEKGTVKVDLIGASVNYTVTKDGIGCPFSGTGAKVGGFAQEKTGVISVEGKKIDVG
jgi:hypothetical protein